MEGVVFKGEKETMDAVAEAGAKYGYGNCIAWLKRKWIDRLKESGLSDKSAEEAVNGTSAYPEGFNYEG